MKNEIIRLRKIIFGDEDKVGMVENIRTMRRDFRVIGVIVSTLMAGQYVGLDKLITHLLAP